MADVLDDARAMLAQRIRAPGTPGSEPSRRLGLIRRLADEVQDCRRVIASLRTELGSEHTEWLENQEELADPEAANDWPLARKQLQAHRSEIRRLRKLLEEKSIG